VPGARHSLRTRSGRPAEAFAHRCIPRGMRESWVTSARRLVVVSMKEGGVSTDDVVVA
jgi:hypothetical protein